MLNDWSMHHLHLGLDLVEPNLARRTGVLLFAIVHPDDLYVVAVGNHRSWTDRQLLEIMYANWPSLFAGRVLPLHAPPTELSDADYKKARNAGVMVLLTLNNGLVIAPPGGGSATSRRSVEVTRAAVRLAQEAATLESQVLARLPEIREVIESRGIPEEDLEFHLARSAAGVLVALDNNAGLVVELRSDLI